MAQVTGGPFAGANEQQVEKSLREIVATLDWRLERLNALLGATWVIGVPAVICFLWLGLGWTWWVALLWGAAGSLVLTIVIVLPIEWGLARRAARAFDARFPEGSPERALALHVLPELRTPLRAGEKLNAELGYGRVTRQQGTAPEAPLDAALAALSGASPAPAPPPPSPAPLATPEEPPAPRRSGGAYDYVPLEPTPRAEEQGRP